MHLQKCQKCILWEKKYSRAAEIVATIQPATAENADKNKTLIKLDILSTNIITRCSFMHRNKCIIAEKQLYSMLSQVPTAQKFPTVLRKSDHTG